MVEKDIILETDRLILRRYYKKDLQDLYEYLSDEEVVKYEPYKAMDMKEVEGNLDWRISTDEMIAVVLKADNKMIGNVYFWKDENGNPIWKDTFVYSLLKK